jgi:inosine-uridine nucleoside N-ribohydrolase
MYTDSLRICILLICGLLAGLCQADPEKVIFDTDCAFFNDDGAALVMLLERPRQAEVLGLTIVPGNLWPRQGAEYMFHILRLMKRPEIPLHLGAQAPLVHTRAMALKENRDWGPIEYLGAFENDPPQSQSELKPPFGGKFSGLTPARRNAIDFLIETIDQSPGQVTLLAIGPMTNVAIALRLRPDLESKIRRLVFMGGTVHARNYDNRAAEFNFWFDPEAAQVVLRSGIRQKTMFGLDICNRARINRTHFDQIVAVKTPITELFREDMGNRYPGFLKKRDAQSYIWDCLAAGYLLDPSFVVKRESAYLDVDTSFGKNYGAVIPLDRTLAPQATPVEVMLDLDFRRFFELYKGLLTTAP